MAKRTINKSRIKRLLTFPWAPGVMEKDLSKVNYEELKQIIASDWPKTTSERINLQIQYLVDAYEDAHEKFEAALKEQPPVPTFAEPEWTPPSCFEYMVEQEDLERWQPGLSREQLEAKVKEEFQDVFDIVWFEEDECFLFASCCVVDYPFPTMYICKADGDMGRESAWYNAELEKAINSKPWTAPTELEYMVSVENAKPHYLGSDNPDTIAFRIQRDYPDLLACIWSPERNSLILYAEKPTMFEFEALYVSRGRTDKLKALDVEWHERELKQQE